MNYLLIILALTGFINVIACPICFNQKGKIKHPYFHEDNIDDHAESFESE